tara:strand:+ start:346 stop:519 length:174 start_codon:yes stop_codon:yes gene_type:complete
VVHQEQEVEHLLVVVLLKEKTEVLEVVEVIPQVKRQVQETLLQQIPHKVILVVVDLL